MNMLERITNYLYPKLIWILPLIFGIWCLARFLTMGPFYLHQNGDYNYVYLLAGLDWLHFESAGVNDQPGLPLKLVNAIGILVLYAFRFVFVGARDLDADVLSHPENYISVISLSVFLVAVWAFYRLLKVSQKFSTSKTVWVIAACSIFYTSIPLLYIFVNKPEPYLFIAGCWMASIFIRSSFGKKIKPLEIALCFLFGILSKIFILPIALALFWIPVSKEKQWHSVVYVIGFIVLLSFFNTFAFERFTVWIVSLFLHSGAYGSGGLTVLPYDILHNLWTLLFTNKLLVVALIASAIYLLKSKKKSIGIWNLMLGSFLFLAIMLKLPNSHYFIVLYPILLAVILLTFKDIQFTKLDIFSILSLVAFLGLVSFSFSKYIQPNTYIGETEKNLGVQTYFSSTSSYNLFLANQISSLNHSEHLYSTYPNDTFYTHYHHFATHKGNIPYQHIRCQEFDVFGTSNFIQYNRKLEITYEHVHGLEYHFKVKVKDVNPEGREYRVEECE